jgi:alpha-amylase
MNAVCFYFQVHQPFRLRKDFSFFSIGGNEGYEDDAANRGILRKVADRCYLPTNRLLLELIEKHGKRFKLAFSVSGVALEQFERWAPDVLQSFKDLAATGSVEFLGETWHHSLSYLFSEEEFKRQVKKHRAKIKELFGQTPKTFRNTELIYDNRLARVVEELGYTTLVAEGADRVLGWRSPNFVYTPAGAPGMKLLLKNYRLSDDVAFRFSDRNWSEWPLTADRWASWVHKIAGSGDVVNLFMDYETFGEHQWAETGIFDFLRHVPGEVLKHPDFAFMTPREVAKTFPSVAELHVDGVVSWADQERDLTAWLGNAMQNSAAKAVFALEKDVLATRSEELLEAWRRLTTSDHFYYMCTKFWADGDVHKYFSPYDSPYDAFIFYVNALNQLRWQVQETLKRRRKPQRTRTRRPAAGGYEPASVPMVAAASAE